MAWALAWGSAPLLLQSRGATQPCSLKRGISVSQGVDPHGMPLETRPVRTQARTQNRGFRAWLREERAFL